MSYIIHKYILLSSITIDNTVLKDYSGLIMSNKAPFKPVSIMNKDYAILETVRNRWIKQHNVTISMPKMVVLAMEEYDGNHKDD